MGFPTPLQQWLREPRAEPLLKSLLAGDGLLANHLHMDPIRRMIGEQRNGSHDRTDQIWRLLNLQIWGDQHITGRKERWEDGVLPPAAKLAL